MKKFSVLMMTFFMFVTFAFSENIIVTEFKCEADILMKKNDANPSKFGWRNVLYAENYIEEGSSQVYLIKTDNVKKGYSAFSLSQKGGKPVSISANGKEQKIIPGKAFSKKGGTVWLSFKAPDKKVYSLPTDISILSKDDMTAVEAVYNSQKKESEPLLEAPAVTDASDTSDVSDTLIEEDVTYYEPDLIKDSSYFPESDADNPVAAFAGINRQTVEKGSNVSCIVKNLPEGTRPKLFMLDGTEVLVYIAPDITLRDNDNCYSLFYSTRRADRDEDFSIPKRVVENPKVNGKLTNMLDFDGIVTNVNGKKKLVLCWTQLCQSITEGLFEENSEAEEELLKMTRVYWTSWKENDERWDKTEIISDLRGSLQFMPQLVSGPNGVCLKITNRTDNFPFSLYYNKVNEIELNPAFPVKYFYYVLNKKGHWDEADVSSFPDREAAYPLTDSNRVIPGDYQYVYNKDGVLSGVIWASGSEIFAKSYIKDPQTKKMIWTESVPVLYQGDVTGDGNQSKKNVYFPNGIIRSGGEWIFTYVRETSFGYELCVSRINNEPCLITHKMWPNAEDMQHPGSSVRFTVEIENAGLGIADGLEVLIRNEFKAEAGKVSYKKTKFYPGTKYTVNAIYQSLKGKDGIVPVEDIHAELKLPKMKKNSQFGHFDAKYTMGIPIFHIGDMFTVTKGKSQKVVFTCGTQNGVKVKKSTAEAYITEHAEGVDYDDNYESVLIDDVFSDTYCEYSYDYETGAFDEPVFDFTARLHYSPEKFKIPGYDYEDLDDSTAYEYTGAVRNPLYFNEPVTLTFDDFIFTKKTKVMKVIFTVTNNWPEVVKQNVKITLSNNDTFQNEQVLDIPVELDILQNMKYEIEFDPASSDNEEIYAVYLEKTN